MNQQASRIVRFVAAAAMSVAAMLPPASDAQSTGAPTAPSKRPSRSFRLRDWVAAVERHQPGSLDESLDVFDSWRADDFEYLPIDLNTMLILIEDPSFRVFFYQPDSHSRPKQIVYNGSDLRVILELATTARARTGEDKAMPVAERLNKNRNHVLERAAIFHTDVALATLVGGRSARRAPEGVQSFTLVMPDGRPQGLTVEVGHLELARMLLDKVVPAPGRDEFVRRWYIATAAYLEGLGQLSPGHFDRGLHWFPDDAELLFFAACLHESLAESRIQEAMQSAAIPRDVKFDISSRGAELRSAEALFRRALKVQPGHLEARIRLGRVLSLRGEHAEAETVLRAALNDAQDPQLAYLANLFLASELEARGEAAQARDLYTNAAALYPTAQSPRLALGALAARDRNQADTLRAAREMSAVLAVPAGRRIDPWWAYHQSQGRNAPLQLAAAYTRFLDEDRR